MSTETSTTAVSRVITIYSSQGKNNNKISFTGATWAELKSRLRQEGYNIGSMKAIEGIRRSTLESDKAIIPEVDFNLHLYPHKTKGGAKKEKKVIPPRKELLATVKSIIIAHGDAAKKHFAKDAAYSTKATEELDILLTKWEKKHGVHTGGNETSLPTGPKTTKAHVEKPTKVAEGTTKAVANVVDGLAQYAEIEEHNQVPIKTAIAILKGISDHENQTLIEEAITKLEKAAIPKPSKSEEELLREEHEDIMAGLEGVVK